MSRHARVFALYVLCTGMLMIVLDVTCVNVALPSLQDDLGFSASGLAWVVNAYVIAFAGLLLLAGRIGDLFGRRRVFLAGLVVFTIASALCGLSRSPWELIVARFAQGTGGAMSSAVILGTIVTLFPDPREQARAIGTYAFVASGGGAVGLLAGGVITQWASWHWIFFINLPIGVATLVAGTRLLDPDESPTQRGPTDGLGAVLATAALMVTVYTIVVPAAEDGWTAPATLGCGAAAGVLLAAFVAQEGRAPRPLLPFRILRSRPLAGANAMQLIGSGGMFGSFFLGALFLEHVLHYGPFAIGAAFLPDCLGMAVVSVFVTDRVVVRIGLRPVVLVGLALITVGLALFAIIPSEAHYWPHVFVPMAVTGLGAGLCFPPLMGLAMTGVAPAETGLASGLVNTTGQVGGAVGLAALATVSAARGYHLAFWVAAALLVAAIAIAAATVPGRSRVGTPNEQVTDDLVRA